MISQARDNKALSFIKSNYIKGFFKKYKFHYFFGLIALFAVDYAQILVPLIIGDAIDRLESNIFDVSFVSNAVIKLLSIAFIIYIGRILWRYFIFGSSRDIERDIRNDMFCHLEKMSAKYYQEHNPGEIMAHMTNDLEAVRMALGPGILTLFDVMALGTITVYKMITEIDPMLTAVSTIPLFIIAVSVKVMGSEMHERFSARQEAFAKLTDFTQENLSGIKVIKSFVQEHKSIEVFEEANKNTYDKNMKMLKLQTLMHPYMNMIAGVALAISIGYGGYITIYGRITLGEFAAFIQYLGMLVWPMIAMGMTINMFTMGSASLERIEKILNEPVEIKNSERTVQTGCFDGSVEIRNLNFKYPDTNKYVLNDINLKINKGQTLGIIGRTGSGKTTLVNLLLRIFDPEDKTIFLGGYDILDIPLNTLRKNIGYVPQDNFLFSETISNNIDFGVRTENKEKIIEAATTASVHENIVEFKHGYETLIGERGVSLSGGQKQRISIARALLKDPEILILDDSVSAVDTDTEEKILTHLKEKRKYKTNIIIAHRISTIQDSDLIIMLDEGRIAESGKHKELLDKKGLYSSIYEKQLLEEMIEQE